tara:strand:+ start:824 stop:1012 length:189 start_codon:yes stop_codon:yes gene_type:complete
MSFNKEFETLSSFEKKMVKLSIKYQADLMSMTFEDVENILSTKDWQDLSAFIKNGCKERVLH